MYIGLDALSDYDVAAAVGNSMFADLTSVAGKLYKFGQGYGQTPSSLPRRIAIHADEFNELIGDEFIPPFSSEFDPSEEAEGSIDPLGLAHTYERLADGLLWVRTFMLYGHTLFCE